MSPENVETMKAGADAFSISLLLGALVGWLPAIASVVTIIWTVIRIVETDTFKRFWAWLKKDKTDA